MDSNALLAHLDGPRKVSVSLRTWRAAAVLAGLRVAVNDPFRLQHRNRGKGKNLLADIWGTFGELVALRTLNWVTDQRVRHHPIDFQRSVNKVDLVVDATDGLVCLETKAHLLEAGKSWFMVNKSARERSTLRGAVGYMPVISALGAPHALVGRLISLAEMRSWGPPDKKLKDPAVAVTLEDLAESHFERSLSNLTATVSTGSSATQEQLMHLAVDAGLDLARWRELLPPLEDLPAHEVVDTVNRLL